MKYILPFFLAASGLALVIWGATQLSKTVSPVSNDILAKSPKVPPSPSFVPPSPLPVKCLKAMNMICASDKNDFICRNWLEQGYPKAGACLFTHFAYCGPVILCQDIHNLPCEDNLRLVQTVVFDPVMFNNNIDCKTKMEKFCAKKFPTTFLCEENPLSAGQ